MKRKMFKLGASILSIAMLANSSLAYAGTWNKVGSDWTYINDDKSQAKGWVKTQNGYYYIDETTNLMKTGWLKLPDGQWYFLDTQEGNTGALLTGWQWIDGYCYYFETTDAATLGKLYTDTTTPDGFKVDKDGRYLEDDKPVYVAKKGISSIIQPENKPETDKGAKTGGTKITGSTRSGGGGGGGSSSGGGSTYSKSNSNSGSSSTTQKTEQTENKKTEENKTEDKKIEENKTQENKAQENSESNNKADIGAENNTNKPEIDKKEEPKAETPNKEVPKEKEQPKEETPNNEQPKENEQPKAEVPNKEVPNNEQPKENEKPKAETPNNEQPKENEKPKAETPNNEQPKENEKPKEEVPNNGQPKEENPDNGQTNENEVEDLEFAYTKYTKDVKIDFGEYVAITFKYGTAKDYTIYVDGTDITEDLTNVDDDGHVVKWLSSVTSPKTLKIVSKATAKEQIIDLGGTTKQITKTSVKPPKYVISNGPISVFDYYLETHDDEGNVRKNATKTTFTLQTKSTQPKVSLVPDKYYIPITEIDEVGNGTITIKVSLENEAMKEWFNGLNNIKALNTDNNIINSNLVYTTAIDNTHGATGVITIPLPQDNLRSRGDYYVSVGSSASNQRAKYPISLVSNTNYKVLLSASTPAPKVGQDIVFKIQDPTGRHSFGNDVGIVMHKVLLIKPDGTKIELPKYSGWYNIGELLHIRGTDSDNGKVYTDVAGIYTLGIYTTGYKTMIKKFQVLDANGTAQAGTETPSTNIDSISSPTVNKNHSGNRASAAPTAMAVSYVASSSSRSSVDTVSSASRGNSGGSSHDTISSASGSMMRNVYLQYDYDLLANAMVLNEIGLRNIESSAVHTWWLEQTPEAIIGDDKAKIYKLDYYVNEVSDARMNGEALNFEDYIKGANAPTRNTFGEVKNVLENGKLGTLYRYGNTVGKAAPKFTGLVQPNGNSFTFTTDNTDFISKIQYMQLDGRSEQLRSDDYSKQFSISEDKTSITLYSAAFNDYLTPRVGKHKLFISAPGYEKFDLEFTITDTLEDVNLTVDSEKLEVGLPVVINASNPTDPKNGEFLRKLTKVNIRSANGFRSVISAAAGGFDADDVYVVNDGKITLRGGLFKTEGIYTIILQATGYPTKFIDVDIKARTEEEPKNPDNGNTEPKKALPQVVKATKGNNFFYKSYELSFNGLNSTELDTYLRAVNAVSVNGVDFSKAGGMGLGPDSSKEFVAKVNDYYGGRELSLLAIKSELTNSNKIVIKAKGYDDLTVTLDKNGLPIEDSNNDNTPKQPENGNTEEPKQPDNGNTQPKNPDNGSTEPKQPLPQAVRAVRKNGIMYKTYEVSFKGLSSKDLDKYLKAINAVSVNGEEFDKAGIIGFGFDSSKQFATKVDDAFGGREHSILSLKTEFTDSNKLVIKATGYDNLTVTFDKNGVIVEDSNNDNTPKTPDNGNTQPKNPDNGNTQPKQPENGNSGNQGLGKALPSINNVEIVNSFFAKKYVLTFKDLNENDLDTYLKAVSSLSVNGVEYTKISSLGFEQEQTLFAVKNHDAYGGGLIKIEIKGTLLNGDNKIVIKATGYDDLKVNLDKNGNVIPYPEPASVQEESVTIKKAEYAKYNNAEVLKIELAGSVADVEKVLDDLSEIYINDVKVTEARTISLLSNDGFIRSNDDILYVKSRKIKGLGDKIVLKVPNKDDIVYTTSSKVAVPEVKEAKKYKGSWGGADYVRASFDPSVSLKLKKFMEVARKGDIHITVNGVPYTRAYSISNSDTFKISSNSAYGRDEYIDFNVSGFTEVENIVEVSSDSFDTFIFKVNMPENASRTRNRRALQELEDLATSSNASQN